MCIFNVHIKLENITTRKKSFWNHLVWIKLHISMWIFFDFPFQTIVTNVTITKSQTALIGTMSIKRCIKFWKERTLGAVVLDCFIAWVEHLYPVFLLAFAWKIEHLRKRNQQTNHQPTKKSSSGNQVPNIITSNSRIIAMIK